MTSFRVLALTAALLIAPWLDEEVFAAEQNPMRNWINRPWEIRYMLFVDSAHSMDHVIKFAEKANREPGRGEKTYRFAEGMYRIRSTFKVGQANSISIVLIEFDRAGHVVGDGGRMGGFVGKRNELDHLVLIRESEQTPLLYFMAKWSQGIPGDIGFSPAVCNLADEERYKTDGYTDGDAAGGVGCREWTDQLYRRNRPYIDVTTYGQLRGNFIGDLVGWSRFTDPPKPVIGLQGKTWLCLHECPAGEKTGVIKDIKAWTAKHGYPMPERPSKQPQFPNADYKDDLNEFMD